MVSTRVVIVIGAAFGYFSVGSAWLPGPSGLFTMYTWIDIASRVGSTYGPCHCAVYSTTEEMAYWQAVLPLLVSPGLIAAAWLSLPIANFLSLISLFRWRLMVVSGALGTLSGFGWVAGFYFASGTAGTPNVFSDAVLFGPYLSGIGGIILLLGFFLSRADVLEWPQD